MPRSGRTDKLEVKDGKLHMTLYNKPKPCSIVSAAASPKLDAHTSNILELILYPVDLGKSHTHCFTYFLFVL